jgi:hypothetical protein
MMTLNEAILQKVAEWRPKAGEGQGLSVADESSGWAVNVTADRNDELGCLVWELSLRRPTAPALSTDGLKAWAEHAAKHVTGLLEPLHVVEVDTERPEALLRSERVTQRGNALHYYEARLKANHEAVLRRFQGSHEEGKPRRQVPFALTHEALAKVVGDLTSAG